MIYYSCSVQQCFQILSRNQLAALCSYRPLSIRYQHWYFVDAYDFNQFQIACHLFFVSLVNY